ncbi:ferritin-like domain-containing protein, partial [Arthrobacter sp. Hz1]
EDARTVARGTATKPIPPIPQLMKERNMFEHFNTPEEIFSFKLGSALTMERDTLAMLGELEKAAKRPELKAMLKDHAKETEEQIDNIERSFELLGEKVSDSPSPVTKAMAKEGNSMLGKTDTSLVDVVILVGALETGHHKIAVYETLVTNAQARGASDVAALLRRNLDQEENAKDKVKAFGKRIATDGIAYP